MNDYSQLRKSSCLVAFAIYIGKSHSSCAWSFVDDPSRICTFNLDEDKHFQTTVLFNEKKEFIAFGRKAEERFQELIVDERSKHYLFKKFVNTDSCSEYVMTKAVDGKEMETHIVYEAIIRFYQNKMMAQVAKTGITQKLTWNDFMLVLSVPNVLTRSRQKMLQKALKEAGIEKYILAKEMDAAVLFCKTMWNYWESPPKIEENSIFIVLNLRGTTATIAACRMQAGRLKLLSERSGGGWGGQAVNEEFKQLLIKIVGAPVFMKCCEGNKSEMTWLENDFETKKKTFSHNQPKPERLHMPVQLAIEYETMYGETIETALANSVYKDSITIRQDKMTLSPNVMEGLFTHSIRKIVSETSDIVEKTEGINTIIMIGGFSQSRLVQKAVKEAFPNMEVKIPVDPSFSILRGTVLCGHNAQRNKLTAVSNSTYWFHLSYVNNERDTKKILRSESFIVINCGDLLYDGKGVTWELYLSDVYDMEYIELTLLTSQNTRASLDDSDRRKLWETVIVHDEIDKIKGTIQIQLQCAIPGKERGYTYFHISVTGACSKWGIINEKLEKFLPDSYSFHFPNTI